MQIEKKLILCSILAISIGIAAIVPLQYLMNAKTASALPNVEPWFNINVEYAECNPYLFGNATATTQDAASIQAIANFTLTANAMESDADTQIEYYKFAVSSEQGPICDLGYYIVEGKENIVGVNTSINGSDGDCTITLANGLTYSVAKSNEAICWSGQTVGWSGDNSPSSVYGAPFMVISANNGEELPQAATQLRNAQTLSIDVSKVYTVTVKGNVTVTTPADPTILQHIELTKTDNGFVYGTNPEGTLPDNFTGTLP